MFDQQIGAGKIPVLIGIDDHDSGLIGSLPIDNGCLGAMTEAQSRMIPPSRCVCDARSFESKGPHMHER